MKKNSLYFFSDLKFALTYLLLALFISVHSSINNTTNQSIIKLITKGKGTEEYFLNRDFSSEQFEVIVNGEVKNNCKKNVILIMD